ncbi:hypothetical protein D3C87_2001650 [compost metagenome]
MDKTHPQQAGIAFRIGAVAGGCQHALDLRAREMLALVIFHRDSLWVRIEKKRGPLMGRQESIRNEGIACRKLGINCVTVDKMSRLRA